MGVSSVPEVAIASFERLHGLRVTVHDLRGTIWPHLRGDRFHHAMPVCQAVKTQGGEARCVALEMTELRQMLSSLPDGRFHVCHAGLVEWVVPVMDGGGAAWVLFAGVRRPGRSLRPGYVDPPSASRRLALTVVGEIATVDQAEANDVLEHFRQLAARLAQWAMPALPYARETIQESNAPRRAIIQRFISARHRTDISLADLAATLDMSESRTSHVVREACGRPFRDLVADARLNTAMDLLRVTSLPIIDVAMRSGFEEVGHFHRLFKRRLGTTPRKFRVMRQT